MPNSSYSVHELLIEFLSEFELVVHSRNTNILAPGRTLYDSFRTLVVAGIRERGRKKHAHHERAVCNLSTLSVRKYLGARGPSLSNYRHSTSDRVFPTRIVSFDRESSRSGEKLKVKLR